MKTHALQPLFQPVLLVALLLLALLLSAAQAAVNYDEAGKLMYQFLGKEHLSQHTFDDELSEKALDKYLRSLDPSKTFFTRQDVDRLRRKFATDLDDYVRDGEAMQVARPLYSLYMTRFLQRLEYAKEVLARGEFKLDRETPVLRSRKDEEWPADEEEMKKIWQTKVEASMIDGLLKEKKLDGKAFVPPSEEEILAVRDSLAASYDRQIHDLKTLTSAADVAEALLSAVALVYDPHTEYMGVREQGFFMSTISGRCTSIGLNIRKNDEGMFFVEEVLPGSPAALNGKILPGDRIIAVDSGNTGKLVDIRYMDLPKVGELLSGAVGTSIRIKLEPAASPKEPMEVTLVCAMVELDDELAQGRVIDIHRKGKGRKNVKLGLLRLPGFYDKREEKKGRSCAADVEKILARMVKEKVDGVVIDLRHNGGGSLDETVNMIGSLVGPGPAVQIRNKEGTVEQRLSNCKEALYKGPLIVLTDKWSASASELLSGALQDYGRALIVGEGATYGKGSVQIVLPLGHFMSAYSDRSRAGCLKLTVAKFYRVSGGSTQLKGVKSDIVLPGLTTAFGESEDRMDFVMPYDEVPLCKGYVKDKWLGSILPLLKERSLKRAAADVDLQLIAAESARMEQEKKANALSLNLEKRVREHEAKLGQLQVIDAERNARYKAMEKAENGRYSIFSLSLKDAESKQLPAFRPHPTKEKAATRRESFHEDLMTPANYPFGLDPILREGLNILVDMVDLKKGVSLSRLEPLPPSPPMKPSAS